MRMTTAYLPGDEPATLPVDDETAAEPDTTQDPYWIYDTCKPLENADPALHRRIGVLASKPFHHLGLNAMYVDVHRETVTVNSKAYGNCYPAEEGGKRIRVATEATIADLDRVITELTAHRDRLTAELRGDRKAEQQ